MKPGLAQPARVWIFTNIGEIQPSAVLNALPAKKSGLFGGIFGN